MPTSREPAAQGTASSDPTAHSLGRTLRAFRVGSFDPTTRLSATTFVRAMRTPDGPATLWCQWPSNSTADGLVSRAWGPGSTWALNQLDAMIGVNDQLVDASQFDDPHPVVVNALRERRDVRLGASGDLWHALVPIVLAQRITAREATQQWYRLCRRLGERPPGPAEIADHLTLPPDPEAVRKLPSWTFHRLGIENQRASTLITIARHADQLWSWAQQGATAVAERLAALPGVGPWTIGCALGPVLGDPDAVVVGDFHLPHAIAWALAGEPRATDERMLELLEPYRPQRGRIQSAIVATSGTAPKFGPRRRTIPIAAI